VQAVEVDWQQRPLGALDTGSYVIRLLDGSGRFFRVVKD